MAPRSLWVHLDYEIQSRGAELAAITVETLIAEAEAARSKAMSEKGGAAAAVAAITAKAKLAGLWREKVAQTNSVRRERATLHHL